MADTKDTLPSRMLGNLNYRVKSLCHHPFCHCCRQRVSAVVVLDNEFGGNPLHVCRDCLSSMLKGFDELTPAEKVRIG